MNKGSTVATKQVATVKDIINRMQNNPNASRMKRIVSP